MTSSGPGTSRALAEPAGRKEAGRAALTAEVASRVTPESAATLSSNRVSSWWSERPQRAARTWSARVLMVAVVVTLPLWFSTYWLDLFAAATAYTVVVESVTVLRKATGASSLCQATFMGISAFTMSWLMLDLHWPYLAAAAAGTLIVIPVGMCLAWPALRLRGLELTVLTLAVSLATSAVLFDAIAPLSFSTLGAPLPSTPNIFGLQIRTTDSLFEFLVIIAIFALGVSALILRSSVGMTWQAMRSGRASAAAAGIPLLRMQLVGFGVSAALAGLGGVMLLTFQGDVTGATFSASQSILIVVLVAAFTTRDKTYAVVGGIVIGVGSQLFDAFGVTGDWVTGIFGFFVVIQILVKSSRSGEMMATDG